MTRIFHLGKYYPPDAGGIESVTASLARGAHAAGHNVTVLCFQGLGKEDGFDSGVRIIRSPATKLSSQPLGWRYLQEGITQTRRADVVHVHLPNMLAALLIACLKKGPAVVLHWHSDVVGKGPLAALTRPLERAMLRRADHVICTSQAYAEASEALQHHRHKVTVIPIGVSDVTQHRQHDKTQALPLTIQDFAQERPIVLAVGRLVPYKGYDVLIRAAKLMRHDAAIVVVGGGPLAVELQDQVNKLQLGGSVLLAGRVSDDILSALKQRAQVYCMPSVERSEAFGVSIVEAMAASLPVIATCIAGSGVPWVNQHEESGLNVTPRDPQALADALDQLLGDPNVRATYAKGARQRYERFFTEEVALTQTLALYVAGGNHR